MIRCHCSFLAGAFLLASTAVFAQQIYRSVDPPRSIISLASSPRPQGELLAPHPGDATFERVPANYHVFAAATVGKDAGVEALTLNFAAETTLTRIQSKNKDFVIEQGGTCHEGNSYTHGQSCTLLVRFNPQGPGHRLGFINVAHTADPTPMSFGLTGNGSAPVVSFTPSQITTVSSTVAAGTGIISGATSLAVDGGDIVYAADTTNGVIREVDPSGALSTLTPFLAVTPVTLAVDTAGIVYTLDSPSGNILFSFFTPWKLGSTEFGTGYTPGTCTPAAPCNLDTVGLGSPTNLSIDAYDDLFFEERTEGAAEMPVGIVSGEDGGFVSLNLWYLKDVYAYVNGAPGSFAVDSMGNLYTDFTATSLSSSCFLFEEPLYNAEYSAVENRVAGGLACGYSGDGGQARSARISTSIGQIAFDIAGNLYFADTGNQRVRRIDRLTGIISTVAGNGTAGYSGDGNTATGAMLSNPTGVAVDSQGQVYILSNAPTAGPTQVLRKVGTTGAGSFGPVLKGTNAVKMFTVANTGNDTLTLSANAFFSGANKGDYTINPTATTCALNAGATLPAAHSCRIGINFTPAAAGLRSATLTLLDNTVNSSNIISLSGVGTLPTPTMAITSPSSGSSVKAGTTVTFAASVTSTSATKPTGTVTFKVNGTAIGSPVTLSGTGTASTTFSETMATTYTLSAVYSGDANYAADTVSESLIVTTFKIPVTIKGTPIQ